MRLANKGYDEGGLENYFTKTGKYNKKGTGDTLAEFIVIELIETFEENDSVEDQIENAQHFMERAIDELQDVINALGSPAMLEEVLAKVKTKGKKV